MRLVLKSVFPYSICPRCVGVMQTIWFRKILLCQDRYQRRTGMCQGTSLSGLFVANCDVYSALCGLKDAVPKSLH